MRTPHLPVCSMIKRPPLPGRRLTGPGLTRPVDLGKVRCCPAGGLPKASNYYHLVSEITVLLTYSFVSENSYYCFCMYYHFTDLFCLYVLKMFCIYSSMLFL